MKAMPLLSWDLYSGFYFKNLKKAEQKTDLEKIHYLTDKYNWKNSIDSIIDEGDYEAIIITDVHRKIIWVNNGFTKMTGYSKNYALHKKPSFLQGEETSIKTKTKIRKNLKLNKPFKQVIVNYKKDKTPYKCEVQIIPMYSKGTTHFIALEKEIS